MLAMTRKILQWLQNNEAQLQDIDYADGVDDDVIKRLVYRRPGLRHSRWRQDDHTGLSYVYSQGNSESGSDDSSWTTWSEHIVDSSDDDAELAEDMLCNGDSD